MPTPEVMPPDTSSTRKSRGGFLTWAILRDIAIVAGIVIVSVKLAKADLKIDLAAFSFSDLMSLLLAIFSVALSVAFYFKATDTSNKFYDNTYKFTKEISELLGRIEAGFGEKLRHIDEGYSDMRQRIDRIPYQGGKTHADTQHEVEALQKGQAEQKELIDQFAMRAKVDEAEKRTFIEKLEAMNDELQVAQGKLSGLRADRQAKARTPPPIDMVVRHVARQMWEEFGSKLLEGESPPAALESYFQTIKPRIFEMALQDMVALGLMNTSGELTPHGFLMLRRKFREAANESKRIPQSYVE